MGQIFQKYVFLIDLQFEIFFYLKKNHDFCLNNVTILNCATTYNNNQGSGKF